MYRACLTQVTPNPVLVGPFYGEVGFEALYWLPFVWALHLAGVSADRLIPFSRGGAACWYGTKTGLEIYGMRSAQEVRIEVKRNAERTGLAKQTHVTAFDRDLIADARKTLGYGRDLRILHPAWMFQTLRPFWAGERGLHWLAPRLAQAVIVPPPLPDGLVLPADFVAVKFYARSTFPYHPGLVSFVQACVDRIAQRHPVIILDQVFHVDDHIDFPIADRPNVQRLSTMTALTLETHLAVTSAVLARARGFVGTYGGFAQLALRLKRPTVCFYDTWQHTAISHLHASQALALQLGIPFHVLSLAELPMLQDVLPIITVAMKPSSRVP